MATGGGSKAIIAALVANLGIAIAKFVGFLITRATSLLAESVHSLADSGNQALLLLGMRRAARPPTDIHPFGYARARYFWAFVVALVLFSLGGLFSIYEGVEKLTHLEPVVRPEVGVGILVVGIILETFSFRTAIVEANRVRHGKSWWQFIRHSRAPELPVVLLEDLGALVGLVLALIGVVLAWVTGNPVFDAYGTLAIGVLLFVIAVILAIEMQSLLMGEAASPADVQRIRSALETDEAVVAVLGVRTQHLGPEQLLIGAHVRFQPTLSLLQVVQAIDRIETQIRGVVPGSHNIYIEPDHPDGPQTSLEDLSVDTDGALGDRRP